MNSETKKPDLRDRFTRARAALWHQVTQQFARELLRDLYRGIFERDIDADGEAAYLGQSKRMGRPVSVIEDLIGSAEFRHKSAVKAAPAAARALYRGVLGRDPAAADIEAFTARLAHGEDLESIALSMAASEECQHKNFAAIVPDLVRAFYHGLFQREPDDAGMEVWTKKLSRMEDLGWALDALTGSEEFQQRGFMAQVPDLVRAFHRGILGREATGAEMENCANRYPRKEELESLVLSLVGSDEFERKTFASFAPAMVRAFYRGILKREPDEQGLEAWVSKLVNSNDVEGAVAHLVGSEECQHKNFAAIVPDLVRAFYHGLFQREPDDAGMEAWTKKLSRMEDLGWALDALTHSNEFLQKHTSALPPADLADGIYQGLLGREASEVERAHFSAGMTREGSLAEILREITRSDEFQNKNLAVLAPDLAQSFYRGVLARDADPKAKEIIAAKLTQKENLPVVLADMVRSEEFKRFYTNPKPLPHPRLTYDKPCWAFLHIEKTAGTAIQNLLASSFPPQMLLREHSDTLHRRPAGELSQYSVFAGHFNHDSLAFIPRKKISVLTFVREPHSRLYSLYHFLRAHEPGHPYFALPMRLANELGMEEFYRQDAIKNLPNYWNHMTWVVMGQRSWSSWRKQSAKNGDAPFGDEFVEGIARPAIRGRLRGFAFVGLQDEFDRSVDMMFAVLNRPRVERPRGEHSLESLMENSPHFKRSIDKQPLTPAVAASMDKFSQLDRVLYQEAKILFEEHAAKQGQTDSTPPEAPPPAKETALPAAPAAESQPAKRKSATPGRKKQKVASDGE